MTETNTGVVCESKPKKNEVCVPLARCCLAADSLQSDTRLLPQHPSPMGQHCSAISPRSPVGTLVPLCFFKSVKTAVTNIEFRKTAYLIVILASLWGSMNSYISKCLSCNDHTAEATQPLFWLSRSPGVKAIHPYVGWTLLKAFRMTRSIWCPYLPLFLKSEKVSSFFVLFRWYLLLAGTDWFYLNIFPALFLIYGKFQIYQRVICFDLHLEHILIYLPCLELLNSLWTEVSATYQALLHHALLHSCGLSSPWKMQFPIIQLWKPQLRNNSSFGSVMTQLHWPCNSLLVCKKPNTFMWYLNQLDLQLISRLQICSQRQQPYHGCKSTLFIYYNIIIIIIIIYCCCYSRRKHYQAKVSVSS